MDMQALELAHRLRYEKIMELGIHFGKTASTLLSRFSRKILGLDIRSDSVNAVLIKSSFRGISIEDHYRVEITDSMKSGGNAISEALDILDDRMDIAGDVCVVSFPFDGICFRNLDVPFKDKRKIRQILPFELEPALPYSIKEMAWDFQIADADSREGDKTPLIAVSVSSEEMRFCLDILKAHGLDPETVTISGYAAACAFALGQTEVENWILADIHADRILVYYAWENRIRMARCIPVFFENNPEGAGQLAESIRWSSLAVFEQFGPDAMPGKLILAGCDPTQNDLKNVLEESLGLPVYPLDLVHDRGLRFATPIDSSWRGNQFDNSLALVLTETHLRPPFNFRRNGFAKKKFWVEYTADLMHTGIFAALVIMMFLVGYFADIWSLKQKVGRMDQEIAGILTSAFPQAKISAAPLEQMKANIQEQMKGMISPGETGSHVRIIDILDHISTSIPKELDVNVTKLAVSPGNATIVGDTDNFNSVDDIKNKLEKIDIFNAVTISSANLDRSGNRVDFKLKLQIE
jgi:general secretion pathway protein L